MVQIGYKSKLALLVLLGLFLISGKWVYAAGAIQTLYADNITDTSATLHGSCTGPDINAQNFFYSTDSGDIYANSVDVDFWDKCDDSDPGAGSFSANLTGLTPNTTYFYQAHGDDYDEFLDVYGSIEEFTTSAETLTCGTIDLPCYTIDKENGNLIFGIAIIIYFLSILFWGFIWGSITPKYYD